MSGALTLYRTVVKPAWLDWNGHLNEGYYVVAFSEATGALYTHADIGPRFRDEDRRSFYTVEAHVRYLREVPEGTALHVVTRVLAAAGKRLHFCHEMRRDDDGSTIATHETLALLVDTDSGRTVAMDGAVLGRLGPLVTEDRPDWVGRAISLPGAAPMSSSAPA